MEREELLIFLLTVFSFIPIIGSFLLTNNFYVKPMFAMAPFVVIIMLFLSIIISLVSYKITKEKELDTDEYQILYKLIEAVNLSCSIIAVILLIVTITIYFI